MRFLLCCRGEAGGLQEQPRRGTKVRSRPGGHPLGPVSGLIHHHGDQDLGLAAASHPRTKKGWEVPPFWKVLQQGWGAGVF